jgi:proteasome lid subunit RPN8/RPN11
MPENVSEDRKRLCRAYGARLVFTDAFSGSDGAMLHVREKVAAEPERYFYADQYRNPANPLAHYRTTGPEIWDETAGRITHFVAGLGTTGTIVGTGRYLHERNPRVRVIAAEPDEPLHGLEGLKHLDTAIVPAIWDPHVVDERRPVSTEAGVAACTEVLQSDGLFVGHSAGAALVVARDVARELDSGTVVVLLPDGGELRIGRPELDQLLAEARGRYPFEACGVLVGVGHAPARVKRVVAVVNRETEQPRVRYQIAPEDLIRVAREARDRGEEIVGYFHSHPDHPARPSETDRRIAAEGISDGVFHVVVGVERGERAVPTAWVFRDAAQSFEEEPLDIE